MDLSNDEANPSQTALPHNDAPPPQSPQLYETTSPAMSPQIGTLSNDESDDPSDGESLKVRDITEEDAQSMFQVAISRAATHLTSAKTPAAEKAAAFEDRPAGYFDVDSVLKPWPEATTPPGVIADNNANDETEGPGRNLEVPATNTGNPNLGQEDESQEQRLPSPWQHPSKNTSNGSRLVESKSVLQEALGPLKKRSLSGSGDALKKFLERGLPSMPSMPKASSFMPSAPSFFSSNSQSKHPSRSDTIMSLQGSEANGRIPTNRSPLHNSSSALLSPEQNGDPVRPPVLRRVTSHDSSLLYHTPSRSSSLGDDSRWVNVSEQVNSRGKAIFDSIQDRASFKIPSVNMPNILPSSSGKKTGGSPAPLSRKVEKLHESADIDDASMSRFDRALSKLTGDVVIMGGYRGSVLRSAKTHRQVWVPVKVGLNIRKVNLEVGLDPEDEENMEKHIYPSGMLQNIGPVDISKRLFKRLRESPNAKNGTLRIHDYGYDWRLSPHLLSRKLITFLEGLPCNQKGVPLKDRGAFMISHSLGGLITRHAINQRPELVSGVVYAGVPKACVNILGPLRNGDAVLFSSRVLTAQVNFTLRTSFLLLPEDGRCFRDIKTGEEYPVDFFDPEDWIKYRWSPCTDPPLPPIAPPQTSLTNLINMPSSLTNLPLIGKKSFSSMTKPNSTNNTSPDRSAPQSPTTTTRAANFAQEMDGGKDRTLAPKMGSQPNPLNTSSNYQGSNSTSVATTVTIPRDKAIAYLRRTLADTKRFKTELHFNPELSKQNRYPPAAVIYGKETPTCAGAKVHGREGIPCADSYDHLAFGSGDGVVLAKEAMLPEGYHCVKGGRVSSERGHVTLLGDLRAVGRAMAAVLRGRERGIGRGVLES